MKLKYKINPAFVIQKIGDKISLFDAEKSILHTLNETAAHIYQGFQLNLNREKIVQKIAAKYRIKEEIAAKDVEELIKEMIVQRILIRSE